MALMKKCDRCGGEILFDVASSEGWCYIRVNDEQSYDICSQCYHHFIEFMKVEQKWLNTSKRNPS